MAVTNPSVAAPTTQAAPTTPTYSAPFLQPLAGQLANYTAGLLTTPTNICGLMPQVAQQNVLQQGAQQAAATQGGLGALQYNAQGQLTGVGTCGSGIAGYQPYLNQASALASNTGYQQYMSPYQQQVIDPTLQEYDIQSQISKQQVPAAAIQAGAFGGARCGIQQAQYQSNSDLNRAKLLAQLEQSGYTQALGQANIGVGQQQNLATLQPQLTAQNINLLSTAGAGQQAYSQNILNAAQQGNQISNQYPLQRLSGIAGLYSTIAQATPGTPGSPLLSSPALAASQAYAYGQGIGNTPATNINVNNQGGTGGKGGGCGGCGCGCGCGCFLCCAICWAGCFADGGSV
jgi:hypothetical protein